MVMMIMRKQGGDIGSGGKIRTALYRNILCGEIV